MSKIDMIRHMPPPDSKEPNPLPSHRKDEFSELLEASSRKETEQAAADQKASDQTVNEQKTDEAADSERVTEKPETDGWKDVEAADHDETGEQEDTASAASDSALEQAMAQWLESQARNAARVNSGVPAGDETAAVTTSAEAVAMPAAGVEAALDVAGMNSQETEAKGVITKSAGETAAADSSQLAGELASEQGDSAIASFTSETAAATAVKHDEIKNTRNEAVTVTNGDRASETDPKASAEVEHESPLVKTSAESGDSQTVRLDSSEETVYAGGNQVQNPAVHNQLVTGSQPEAVTVKTTPDAMPEDVGRAIAANLPESDGTMTIELEPVSLGKLTIRVVYEEGRAAVSILSSNAKTLELLSQKAGEIAQILEDKTGQQTVIYTPEAQYQQQMGDSRSGGREQQEQHREQETQHDRQQPDSFAQQLRLGLV